MERVTDYLKKLDADGRWDFRPILFARRYGLTDDKARDIITQAEKEGRISRFADNIWYNPKSPNVTPFILDEAVSLFRPDVFSYISFESALYRQGVIFDVIYPLTVATEGESGEVETAEGRIIFNHVDIADVSMLMNSLLWDPRGMRYMASPVLALEDLKTINRNLNLVDMDALEIAFRNYPLPCPDDTPCNSCEKEMGTAYA